MRKNTIKLLVVEDERLTRDLIKLHLDREAEPIETVFCDTLSQAREEVRRRTPDISVLDLNLPDSSGVSTFERFHKFTEGLVVIVCSGFVDDQTRKQLNELGAAAVIDKPFDWSELIALIRTKASQGITKLGSLIKNGTA